MSGKTWAIHRGGFFPLTHPRSLVDVELRSGVIKKNLNASNLDWAHDDGLCDIVKWRFSDEEQPVTEQPHHFNSPGLLPPVGCRLLIKHPEFDVIEVERPQFVTSLSDDLVYDTTMGVRITGRFPWTYP